MTSALGPFVQASSSLTQVVASPQSGAEVAVVTTIDITLLILGPILGAIVGVVVSVVLSALGRKALAKSATASSILRRIHQPAYFTFAAWGAWVGEGIALVNPGLSDWEGTSVTTFLMHILLVVGLAFLTWMAYAAAWVFEDAAKARQSADKGRSRRFETQAQVFRRLTQSIIVGVGIVAIIGTFEAARQAMTTLLASAGLLSVIVGLAAQQTLGNVFAGLQLAFTDAIRVGDVVVAGDKQETGSVEEITLSYVVVRIWDERRLIVPCRYFTTTPFENWTRRAAAQLGTVELKLDWTAPMSLIRAKVENLLDATDLWDGRTWGVQITDSDEYTVTVRVLVSAKHSGALSDLRAYLREQLIAWIVTEEPWARPAQRIEPRKTVTVEYDNSRERIARLASELAGISGVNESAPTTGAPSRGDGRATAESATGGAASAAPGAAENDPQAGVLHDAAHAARMVAARRKAKRARRRAMADRQRALAEGGHSPDETQVLSKSALRKIIEAAARPAQQAAQTRPAPAVGRGERFFSGSADADERAAALEGPGEEAYAEREADSRRARDRREGRGGRAALDPEVTTALAAVGVEPVDADAAAASGEPCEREGNENAALAPANDAVTDQAAPADESDPEAAIGAEETVGDETGSAAEALRAQPSAPESVPATRDASAEPEDGVDESSTRASERDGAPHQAGPADESGEETVDASPQAPTSPDQQETTPIPARETSVKHPVQVPPPERTGRPVMTDTVQALSPALVPPPAPTPAEMAASRDEAEDADQPDVHPGWYAVAEEARLDAETRPTPRITPQRVSIMDFFPSPAPGERVAEALRAEASPAEEPHEEARPVGAASPEEAQAGAREEASSALAEAESASDADAASSEEPDAATPKDERAADSTEVLPALDTTRTMPALDGQQAPEEQPALDDTLIIPASADRQPPGNAASARKTPAKKSGASKGAAKKADPAKGSGAKTPTKKTSAAAKAPAKKSAAKKSTAKKAPAKKGTAKKNTATKKSGQKTSSAKPATNE
ncbi:mechanosensitive ion channel domain-containing protein [Schaalia odontolytica]|uniref:mechanosensitive ion channel domain-containing protein n=1 Tax=Schaalia odontolytica TaxID=1660 RepID=UPI00211BDEE4|nr:mechanosensitive ion channel domain-containing protein [Schaalia odontolytica]UUO92975.1 mechanosensitive ion channel [Schaalia odontolytica]